MIRTYLRACFACMGLMIISLSNEVNQKPFPSIDLPRRSAPPRTNGISISKHPCRFYPVACSSTKSLVGKNRNKAWDKKNRLLR